ncbi:hypothetical protein Tco_1327725 [Tanacetum coccineum]
MVNTRTDAELAAAVQAAVDAMLPQIREQVREEYRTGAVASGSNPPPVTIHTWLERFNKQKPRSFEKAVAPVDAENWISHMEKIFDVMDCNDAFKTRLAVYKFEGDALAWWKAYKQAKGGDAWVLTLTWAAFKELFFLQFFPRAEFFLILRLEVLNHSGDPSNKVLLLFGVLIRVHLGVILLHLVRVGDLGLISVYLWSFIHSNKMVNTRTDAELAAAVQAAVDAMLPQIREQVREEYRTGAVASGSNPPPVTIHTWLERFNKQKPRSFEKAVAPVDAENWISHMEKIFDVMDCNDAFKTRLAVYKFEGDALAWWKAYKQAKGGDAWVLTLTWAAFKELFFLQFFPRADD